jgi:uncharacterized membrane protein
MSVQHILDTTQLSVLHVTSAGLTATWIAGVFSYVPLWITGIAAVMAIISYGFTIADSPSFQKLTQRFRKDKSEKI